MDKLEHDIIEIDGVLYSRTGNITKIVYDIEHEQHIDYTSLKLETEEEIKKYLSSIYEYKETDFMNITTSYNEVKTLEEIPTIKKSKEDGSVILEEPSNNIKHSLIKKILK